MQTDFPELLPKANYKKILKYFFITVFITIFHSVFLDFLEIMEVTPDLFILLVVWITLNEGRFVGLVSGFAIGLYVDAISADVLGTNALSKTITAFIASYFYNENSVYKTTKHAKFLLIVLLSVFVHNMIYTFFYIRTSEQNFLIFYTKNGLFTTIYTTFFAVFVLMFQIPYNRIRIDSN